MRVLYFVWLTFLGVTCVFTEEKFVTNNVKNSGICLKCYCDTIGSSNEYNRQIYSYKTNSYSYATYAGGKILDCRNQRYVTLTDDDWVILQNADIKFDTMIFSHANLTSVPHFPSYPVRNLYLGFNQISKIEKGAFANLTELEILDLSNNYISSDQLDSTIFQLRNSSKELNRMKNLRELHLQNNLLKYLNSDVFEQMGALEVLNISYNKFQVINSKTKMAFSDLTTLKKVGMAGMDLYSLPKRLFDGAYDLEEVDLSRNLFEATPENLKWMKSIKKLILDGNRMEDFAYDNAFPSLPALEYLSISYMPLLRIINNGTFSELPNLKTLIAANNPILRHIDSQAFASRTAMEGVYDYPPIEKLDLHNNSLSTLDKNLLVRWDKVKSIDLKENAWRCDCQNDWLINTLLPTINTNSYYYYDYRCQTPDERYGADMRYMKGEITNCEDEKLSRCIVALIGFGSGTLFALLLVLSTFLCCRFGCCCSSKRKKGNFSESQRVLISDTN